MRPTGAKAYAHPRDMVARWRVQNAFTPVGRVWVCVSYPGCRFALPWAMRLLPLRGAPAMQLPFKLG